MDLRVKKLLPPLPASLYLIGFLSDSVPNITLCLLSLLEVIGTLKVSVPLTPSVL